MVHESSVEDVQQCLPISFLLLLLFLPDIVIIQTPPHPIITSSKLLSSSPGPSPTAVWHFYPGPGWAWGTGQLLHCIKHYVYYLFHVRYIKHFFLLYTSCLSTQVPWEIFFLKWLPGRKGSELGEDGSNGVQVLTFWP